MLIYSVKSGKSLGSDRGKNKSSTYSGLHTLSVVVNCRCPRCPIPFSYLYNLYYIAELVLVLNIHINAR